jgi:triosephosphate isomerase
MPERQPFIAGNWKMHKTLAEATALAGAIRQGAAPGRRAEVGLAPPYTALAEVAQELAGSDIRLAAQDTHWEKQGAYTGAISPLMLADVGCHYVIIGHSERRQLFGETNHTVNLKVKAVLAAGLKVILCVGETKEERQAHLTIARVEEQLREGLVEVSAGPELLVIAYEPVWAIGTGKTATSSQAQEVHEFLRSLLKKSLGQALADSTRILYGGSVKPGNIAELMGMPDVDGALVGGASLDADTFSAIVHY